MAGRYFLAKNPKSMARLEAELEEAGLLVTVANPHPRPFSFSDIGKLHFLDAVIKVRSCAGAHLEQGLGQSIGDVLIRASFSTCRGNVKIVCGEGEAPWMHVFPLSGLFFQYRRRACSSLCRCKRALLKRAMGSHDSTSKSSTEVLQGGRADTPAAGPT